LREKLAPADFVMPAQPGRRDDRDKYEQDFCHNPANSPELGIHWEQGILMNRRSFIIGAVAMMPSSGFAAAKKKIYYRGAEVVEFETPERRGTVIVNTEEKALYHMIGWETAIRYGVAVGKEGFDWAGIAKVGRKVEWPTWTPPASMISRRPDLEKWRYGMPGGPDNPLGARAIYLFEGNRDTLFRIHGTNEPESIGTAASSGCIRMLNEEVSELYESVHIGTKVIVI
jgi:lipoprotein-anchoring transpeptidase ErfK/SrfK